MGKLKINSTTSAPVLPPVPTPAPEPTPAPPPTSTAPSTRPSPDVAPVISDLTDFSGALVVRTAKIDALITPSTRVRRYAKASFLSRLFGGSAFTVDEKDVPYGRTTAVAPLNSKTVAYTFLRDDPIWGLIRNTYNG